MQKNEIEKLIQDKIKDAKLELAEQRFEMSEKRMKFALSLVFGIGVFILTVFGVVVPLVITNQSSDRVDKAITEMERKFEKLAGTQLREPEIKVFIEGQEFKGGVLIFTIGEGKSYQFVITNVGEKIANNLIIRLYTESEREISFVNTRVIGSGADWQEYFDTVDLKDEKDYPMVYQLRPYSGLEPKDSFAFALTVVRTFKDEMRTASLLKIIYGRPEPLRIPFELVIEKKQ